MVAPARARSAAENLLIMIFYNTTKLLGSALLVAFCVACTPPPEADSANHESRYDPSAGPKGTAGAQTEPSVEPGVTPIVSAAEKEEKGCCIYCLDGVPNGDKCVDSPRGEAKAGCACDASQRPTPKFRKGQRVKGLIAADVYAYNKAQGDPVDGPFTLEQASLGNPMLADTSNGKLTATFMTSLGDFKCRLFEKETPLSVANFVGLALGSRPTLDPKSKKWTKKPFYDGLIFHRVIRGFMIQTGDPFGSGTGGPGFNVVDEFDPSLRHTSAGILSMANRNPIGHDQKLRTDPKTGQKIGNTGSSQFFVTVGKTPHLDNRHTIFGKCDDPKTPIKISKVQTSDRFGVPDRPAKDVKLLTIKITREK